MNKRMLAIGSVGAVLCVAALYAQQSLHPRPGTIWISWEEDGHRWMVGALKEFGNSRDDPGFVQTDFGKGYTVKVQGAARTGDGILFHNCCTTNVIISTNFTGTVTIGTRAYRVDELVNALNK